MKEALEEIAHQLTRIADQGEQAGMQISRGDALEAWGLLIYEDDFLNALTRLGIEVTDWCRHDHKHDAPSQDAAAKLHIKDVVTSTNANHGGIHQHIREP